MTEKDQLMKLDMEELDKISTINAIIQSDEAIRKQNSKALKIYEFAPKIIYPLLAVFISAVVACFTSMKTAIEISNLTGRSFVELPNNTPPAFFLRLCFLCNIDNMNEYLTKKPDQKVAETPSTSPSNNTNPATTNNPPPYKIIMLDG